MATKSKSSRKRGEVIHVAFGPGGGRIVHPEAPPPPPRERRTRARTHGDPGAQREPVTDVFSAAEVERLLGISAARLRSLDRASIVSPSATRRGRRAYSFQDLIALRVTHDLLEHRVRLRDVAQAVGALRQALPRVTRPLQELRIVSDGRRVVVQSDHGSFEPVSGQMVLDFRVNHLRDDVVRVLRPNGLNAQFRTAYDLYMQASGLDEDPTSFDEAEALYVRALDLDPSLAIAYTNLGNIHFRRGNDESAIAMYEKALSIDDRQPEAHYNLGYVMLERGEARRAAECFERALEADPRFSDAHFNLAMAYEAAGERARARVHWKRYLDLEPRGAWADIAREHL